MTEIDSDAEPECSPNRSAPQTPPRNAKVIHHTLSHYAPTTPKSSPPASPSLSLYSLGVSPLSPMRRQFSSSFVKPSSLHPPEPDHSEQDDLVQDSKDVLVQRLNDLATQLSQQDHLKEDSVYGLHAKVDEMERVLSRRDYPLRRTPQRSRPSSSKSEHERFWGSLSPGRIIPSISNVPLPTQKSSSTQTSEEHFDGHRANGSQKNQMSAVQAARVVEEAQRLNKELEDVTISLRARQEDTFTPCSSHAQNAPLRESSNSKRGSRNSRERERERNEGEMEMLNLQIQLKAIEVQCLSYVPEDADEELRESISAWKTEWSALKRKRARRKVGAGEDIGTPVTPTRQPRNTTSPG
ncbi:hypothetical protein M434DRAFT_8632 [Hypoxylon sp. CO27-5]|nr:hypothetical protein M434DRAFT_8632 [Hypoxylon sp. CO27-5]